MTMPHVPCAEPYCAEFATSRGRCDRHRKAKDRDRRRARGIPPRGYASVASFYASKRWAMARRKKLLQDSICERCREAVAEEVHHRVKLAAMLEGPAGRKAGRARREARALIVQPGELQLYATLRNPAPQRTHESTNSS